jgi:hypothetical protein
VKKVHSLSNIEGNKNELPPRAPPMFKIKKSSINLEKLNERMKHTKEMMSKKDVHEPVEIQF